MKNIYISKQLHFIWKVPHDGQFIWSRNIPNTFSFSTCEKFSEIVSWVVSENVIIGDVINGNSTFCISLVLMCVEESAVEFVLVFQF